MSLWPVSLEQLDVDEVNNEQTSGHLVRDRSPIRGETDFASSPALTSGNVGDSGPTEEEIAGQINEEIDNVGPINEEIGNIGPIAEEIDVVGQIDEEMEDAGQINEEIDNVGPINEVIDDDDSGDEEIDEDGSSDDETDDDGSGDEEMDNVGASDEEMDNVGASDEETDDDGSGDEEMDNVGASDEEMDDDGSGDEIIEDEGSGDEEIDDDSSSGESYVDVVGGVFGPIDDLIAPLMIVNAQPPSPDQWESPQFALAARDIFQKPFNLREDIVSDSELRNKIQHLEAQLHALNGQLAMKEEQLHQLEQMNPPDGDQIEAVRTILAQIDEQMNSRNLRIQRMKELIQFRPNISADLEYRTTIRNLPQTRRNRSLTMFSSNVIEEVSGNVSVRDLYHCYVMSELMWYRYLREMRSKCREFPHNYAKFWRNQRIPDLVRNYRCFGHVGDGSFGAVKKVRRIDTIGVPDRFFALKMIGTNSSEAEVMNEIETFFKLSSSVYFPKLLSFFYDYSIGYYIFVMDYLDGIDLFKGIYKWFPMLETQQSLMGMTYRYLYVYHLINAVCAFHTLVQEGHNDIKPNNMMIIRNGTFKLIDFGKTGKKHFYHEHNPIWDGFFNHETLQNFVNNEMSQPERGTRLITLRDADRYERVMRDCTHTCVANINWAAPETLNGGSFIPHQSRFLADWWAVGIIAYEMLMGMHPFSESSPLPDQSPLYNTNQGQVLDFQNNPHLTYQYIINRLYNPRVVNFLKSLITNQAQRLGQAPNSADVIQYARENEIPFFNAQGIPPTFPPPLLTEAIMDAEQNPQQQDSLDLQQQYQENLESRRKPKTQLFVHYDSHGLSNNQ